MAQSAGRAGTSATSPTAAARRSLLDAMVERAGEEHLGIDGAPPYLNQAVLIEFDGSRDRLKPRLRAIEARLGRVRPSPDPRLCPIDIDAIGRCDAEAEVWDEKAYAANYARLPLAELGKFCTLP